MARHRHWHRDRRHNPTWRHQWPTMPPNHSTHKINRSWNLIVNLSVNSHGNPTCPGDALHLMNNTGDNGGGHTRSSIPSCEGFRRLHTTPNVYRKVQSPVFNENIYIEWIYSDNWVPNILTEWVTTLHYIPLRFTYNLHEILAKTSQANRKKRRKIKEKQMLYKK